MHKYNIYTFFRPLSFSFAGVKLHGNNGDHNRRRDTSFWDCSRGKGKIVSMMMHQTVYAPQICGDLNGLAFYQYSRYNHKPLQQLPQINYANIH